MCRLMSIYYLLAFMLIRINAEDVKADDGIEDDNAVDNAMEKVEQIMLQAENAEQGVLSAEEFKKLQYDAIDALGELTKLINDPQNAYLFLKSKGIYTVIMENFVKHKELTTPLLILTKTLFTTAPVTTALMMPIKFVDSLLDTIDSDAHMALKAHSLDILAIWLPGNPKVQSRVMRMKGLEPFYRQIDKFDSSVLRTLLTLFNNLLKEHLTATSVDDKRPSRDTHMLNIYKQIGLVERVESPKVCDGLLNIFENVWSNSLSHDDIILSVFELAKSVKPLCIHNFNDNSRALQLFQDFKKHVRELKETENGKIFNIKLLEFEEALEDYVQDLKLKVKDEF